MIDNHQVREQPIKLTRMELEYITVPRHSQECSEKSTGSKLFCNTGKNTSLMPALPSLVNPKISPNSPTPTTPFNTTNVIHAPTLHISDATPHAYESTQSKGKAPMTHTTFSTYTQSAGGNENDIAELHMRVSELEKKVRDALSTAEKWKLQHAREYEARKQLEDEVTTLTDDNTTLKAALKIEEDEKKVLEQQICALSGKYQPSQQVKDIHIFNPTATPDKGNCPLIIPEPSFDLGFTQNSSAPNQCRAVTCYVAPAPVVTLQQMSAVAKRTRSHQPSVSPIPPTGASKVARNFKKCHAYKHLAPEHQHSIDNLACRIDLEGYTQLQSSCTSIQLQLTNQSILCRGIVWWANDKGIKIMYNEIFGCIQKESLSNNVLTNAHHPYRW